jgi:spoIIIJ-associated protein
VKDHVFTAPSVTEAIAAAARALGVPEGSFRYVVLDPGTPGGLGLGATPARIAVLVDSGARGLSDDDVEDEDLDGDVGEWDPREEIQDILGALARAAEVELEAEIEERPEALEVRLKGAGCAWLLERDGEALDALDYLLQRAFGRDVAPRRLVLTCAGQQQRRDDSLRALAHRLAAIVRETGQPQVTRPLNSYERRLIHVVIQDEPGLRTFSVGEGSDRRVTVALAESAGEDPGGGAAPPATE